MREKKEIFIILSDTGTWFTRLIRLYTKAPFNHASIAFDPQLREVYSFGRKRPNNPFIGGFVKEDLRGELFKGASCAIYSCTISAAHYDHIRSVIHRFERDAHVYKYNLLGLFGVMLNIRIERERAYFCSQFVASVFEQVGTSLVPKCSELTTPNDLERSEWLQLRYRGEMCSLIG